MILTNCGYTLSDGWRRRRRRRSEKGLRKSPSVPELKRSMVLSENTRQQPDDDKEPDDVKITDVMRDEPQ